MLRVLLVEDEMLVRVGLKNSINWAKFQMCVVGDVADGKTAWEFYLREKPDLIITDLKMPQWDGMELISRIRENDRQTQIIILTCLEEFDLAKRAIALGVAGYIPKLSMTMEEMEQLLDQVAKQCAEVRQSPSQNQGRHVNAIQEKILKEQLLYNRYGPEEFGRQVQQLGLCVNPAKLLVCIMEINHYDAVKQTFEEEQGYLAKISLQNVLEELFAGEQVELINEEQYHIFLLGAQADVEQEDFEQHLSQKLLEAAGSLQRYFNVSVTFGISQMGAGYGQLHSLYQQGCRALQYRFWCGIGHIYPSRNTKLFSEVCREQMMTLREVFAGWPEGSAVREQGFHLLAQMKERPLEKKFETDVKKIFQEKILSLSQSNEQIITESVVASREISPCETLAELMEKYTAFEKRVQYRFRLDASAGKEIGLALDYISLHYAEPLTLPLVAAQIGLSVNYFSSLFKKEAGVGFVEYLNRVRVERAKELLHSTPMHSYEIALQTGFSEETYFNKVFKRLTGKTPKEYRGLRHNY